MNWEDLVGHRRQRAWFENAVARRRLSTTFLFVGQDGIGKRSFARLLAKSLLCSSTAADSLAACGHCENCVQVDASTHPDLMEIAKPADRSSIPIELLIGQRESRMRSGLCHEIHLRPFSGKRKVAIIDDADLLGQEGANCLLKTLEEPPVDSVMILISTGLQRQLPTVRSRSQIVRFQPLEESQLAQLALRLGLVQTQEQALRLAAQADGSLAQARILADTELASFRQALYERLAAERVDFVQLAKGVTGLADSDIKDAAVKRERLKVLLMMAGHFYRAVLMRLLGEQSGRDHELQKNVDIAASGWLGGVDSAVACWQNCLTSIEHVDRNVNQTALCENWSALISANSHR